MLVSSSKCRHCHKTQCHYYQLSIHTDLDNQDCYIRFADLSTNHTYTPLPTRSMTTAEEAPTGCSQVTTGSGINDSNQSQNILQTDEAALTAIITTLVTILVLETVLCGIALASCHLCHVRCIRSTLNKKGT